MNFIVEETTPLIVKSSVNNPIVAHTAESINQVISESYEKLTDLPYLDNQKIIGTIHEIDPTVPTWAKSGTRPVYTASEVGAVAEGEIKSITLTELAAMWG